VSSIVPGTNVPPISFPGIASGIDYNSIIQKLTSLTLVQNVALNQQIATLDAANTELVTINAMLASVQSALTGLSQPSLFNTYDALSSNTNVATAQGIAGVAATPGTYVIDSTQLATSSQTTNNPAAGHSMLDTQNGGPSWQTTVLDQSYAAIAATNGTSGGTGKVTINGVTVSYDVTTQTLQQILSDIQTQVQAATGDTTFTIGFVAGTDTVQISDTNNPITLGSAGDQGNLLQVLKLDQAQIKNGGGSNTVTGTSGVGGISLTSSFDAANGAGFVTPVTAGTFTINGVQIAVNSGDNLADVLSRINASGAGVTASYNGALNSIVLTNASAGPQSIVLGASSDTSNFLTAAGLKSGTVVYGKQAQVVFQDASGSTQTVYSNGNQVTTAIPGVQLNLVANTGTPFTVTVSQNTSQLVTALNTFVSAYNTTINEIDQATAAPVVTPMQTGSLPGQGGAHSFAGGVLYGNADVESIKGQLENIVAGIVNSGNATGYNSLSRIGLTLDNSFTVVTTANNGSPSAGGSSSTSSNPVQTTTYAGTSGQLAPLNLTQLQQALASNPAAVQNLLNGADGVVTQLGSYLTGVTGLPTSLASGLAGTIPPVSLMQGFENANTADIQSLQQQVAAITDNANQQANTLRQEFVSTETAIAGYQALQSQLSSFFNTGGSSGGTL